MPHSLYIPDATTFTVQPTATLPYLQTLKLILEDSINPVEFMGCLLLPNLRHLMIWNSHRISPPPALQSHAKDLTVEIDLPLMNTTEGEMLTFLRLYPGLLPFNLMQQIFFLWVMHFCRFSPPD